MTVPTCLKCGHEATGTPKQLMCPACGGVYAKLQALAEEGKPIRRIAMPTPEEIEQAASRARELAAQPASAVKARLERARVTGNWGGIAPDVVRAEASAVIVTTTPTVPGREIERVCGVVGGEHAYAFGAIFEEVAGFIRNVAGGGVSRQTIGFLRDGRAHALQALRFAALDVGANAVVGVGFDYEEFSGANQRGVYLVVATGTAVRLAPAAQAET